MKRHILALIPMVLALGSGPAMAQPAVRALAERETRLSAHIDDGVKMRWLTPDQADHMRDRLRKIRKLESYYRSSHGFSAWERRDIERRLNALGARLAAFEHGLHKA